MPRSCCPALVIAFIAFGTALADPHLSQRDVIRIANRKARQVLHYDLLEYSIYFVRYFREEDKWYVNYRHREHARNWFNVEILDSTREASVSLP